MARTRSPHPPAAPPPDRLDLPDHAAPPRTGRPPVWTPERIAEAKEAVLDLIADATPIRRICERDDMPSWPVLRKWLREDAEFATRYARAREDAADELADRVVDVADLAVAGKVDPNAARMAGDAYRWRAAKLKPKVYGDRIDVNTNVNASVQVGWVLDLTPPTDGTPILDGTAVRVETALPAPSDPQDVV